MPFFGFGQCTYGDCENGQGAYIYTDGGKYIGEYKDGNKHGQGTEFWKSGNVYIGEWKDNKRYGRGALIWNGGSIYLGEWRDGNRNGVGTYTWPSGGVYVGEWKDNNMNGQGTYTLSNGKVQEGTWEDSKYITQNNSYKLSEGVIDHKLFAFIKSNNFMQDGRRNLKELSQKGVTLDTLLIEDLDGFPSCGCCDQSAFEIDDMFYFKDDKVLIIDRYYAGDWESSEASYYEFYLYSPDKKKFVRKLRLQSDHPFVYNSSTGYIIDKEVNPCMGEISYTIYNNRFEELGYFAPESLKLFNVDFYWNEKENKVIFKRPEGDIVLDIDEFSRKMTE